MIIPNGASVFVATQPVDFRKGATGLMALVQDGGADPFLCVDRDYVAAAPPTPGKAARTSLPPPHNI